MNIPDAPPATALDRFRQSMIIDYEKWHDGIGYDLSVLEAASPGERRAIEDLLVARGANDWRDVEALAAIDSPRARAALRAALKSRDHRLRLAVADHAPRLVGNAARTASLVAALEDTQIEGRLAQTLLAVERHHPPPVIRALLRGVLAHTGATAVHLVAILMFFHGKARSAFDWNLRPYFLEFNTEDEAERKRLFRDLCGRIGVKPDDYLRA